MPVPTIEDPFADIPVDAPPRAQTEDEEGATDDDDSPEMATATVPAPAQPPATITTTSTAASAQGQGTASSRRPRSPRAQRNAEAAERNQEMLPRATDVVTAEGGPSPRDPIVFWPLMLKNLYEKGLGPGSVMIRVERIGEGVAVTAPTLVGYIDGDEVPGDGVIGPGEQLVQYVKEVLHCGRGRSNGPARYKLYAYLKNQPGSGRMMELRLDHPDEIQAQERRRAEYLRPRVSAGGYQPQRTYPQGMGHLPAAPAYPQGAGHSPSASAPAPAATPLEAMRQAAEAMSIFEQMRQQMIAAGQAPPPPLVIQQQATTPSPAAPAPPPPTAQELAEREELEQWRFEKKLKAAGYVRPEDMPKPPPATPGQVVASAADPIAGFEKMLEMVTSVGNLKGKIAKAFGLPDAPEAAEPAEPPEPVDEPKIVKLPLAKFRGRDVFIPRETKGALDFAEQAFMANLETSGELAALSLGTLAKVLDQTAFGKLLAQLLQRGPAAAAVVEQVKAQGVVGTGTQSLPPQNGAPVLARPKGPMA